MAGKLSPIIIVSLVVVVIVVAVIVFGIVTGKGDIVDPPKKDDPGSSSQEDTIKPVLSLKKEDITDDKVNSVTITATATIEDESGIDEIILPDETVVKGDYATFEAKENKEYTFKVVALNGEIEEVSIKVTEIAEISAYNPYVPEGFSVVSDDVDEGFVIEDDFGNQYVWVPIESGKITRDTSTSLSANYEESSTSATTLVNSVAKYYGFYIARFEASEYEVNDENVAATMQGKVPWTNITYQEAVNACNSASEAFGYEEDIFTSLINSYAWDTVLQWVDKKYEGYSGNTNYGNYSFGIAPTGTTELDTVYNICDLAGNVREWTTEIYKPSASDKNANKNKDTTIQRVVRGGSANLSRTPSSHIGYPENTSDAYWGFRLILCKK